MKRGFKFYIFTITASALGVLAYFLATQPFYINLSVIIFMSVTICLELSNLYDERNSCQVALTTSSHIFLTLNYGVYPSIITYFIALIINYEIKHKSRVKMLDMKMKYFNKQERIKHSNQVVRIVFNISKHILMIACIYYSSISLKIDYAGYSSFWKIAVVYLLAYIIEIIIMMIVLFLNSGKYPKGLLSIEIAPSVFYDMIITVVLANSYSYKGVIGALLVYSILFPLQRTALMYYKIKIQEKELFTDVLTNAYNLRFLEDIILNKLAKKESFSLIMIDLDKFKNINDTYGHSAGDKALMEFSKIMLKKNVKNNYFCRYGGDEFIIVVNNPFEAHDMAQQILRIAEGYNIEYEGNEIKLLLSIGVYDHLGNSEDDLAEVMKKVDKAMYYSKKKGSNAITYYDEAL